MSSFDPSKFATTQTKPLPVCLMLDVSGSMNGQKIDELNRAVKDMLATFAPEERMEREILVSIITFGGPAGCTWLRLGRRVSTSWTWKRTDTRPWPLP